MTNLSNIGRTFYGAAIAEIGLQAIYEHDFPYILQLPGHFPIIGHVIFALLFGLTFTLAGVSILFKKWPREVSLVFGAMLLLILCFYYIPFEILTSPNYKHFDDWENAEKELTFAGGALAIARCFPSNNRNSFFGFLGKLIPAGAVIFAITIICFGILHFVVGQGAASYVPAWIPWHLFWIYFCGAALIGSGISIIFKIKTKLFAALLGIMIFIWFISLHIPRVVVSPAADLSSEITSACLALAYSGIAFVIAGVAKK